MVTPPRKKSAPGGPLKMTPQEMADVGQRKVDPTRLGPDDGVVGEVLKHIGESSLLPGRVGVDGEQRRCGVLEQPKPCVCGSGALDGIGEVGQSGEEVGESTGDGRVGSFDADREELPNGEGVGVVGNGDAHQ